MIKLKNLFPEIVKNMDDYKIHLAQVNPEGNNPYDRLKENEFEEWQAYQNKENFKEPYIFSLVQTAIPDEWIFAGIYKSNGIKESGTKPNGKKYHIYNTELLKVQEDLIGRLIIKYNKVDRNCYRFMNKLFNDFEVCGILREREEIMDFPGYEKINIPFFILCKIIDNKEASWLSALSSVKGVYLIVDHQDKQKRMYVGAAYGEDSFWNRWQDYRNTGHGGNEGLKKLLEVMGKDYSSNLWFSILEIHPKSTNNDYIIQRESFWKDVLLTREPKGYNEN